MVEQAKLLGAWPSPLKGRIEIALKLKGIQYECIEEDVSNKSALLLKYNPVHKKIPVFVHNGKPVAESLVILEYIDETWKDHPILPKHPYDRAIARFWAKFVDEKILQTLKKARGAKDEELPSLHAAGNTCCHRALTSSQLLGHQSMTSNHFRRLIHVSSDQLPSSCQGIAISQPQKPKQP